MPNQEWDKSLETGIDEIDEQHRELFNRIDKLELAMYEGKGAAELKQLVEFLISYVDVHFEAEERIMLDAGYSGFAKHAHQHNEFRVFFNELMSSCRDRGPDSYLAIDVNKKLRAWWENHILKMDMEYIPHIKKG